MFSYYPDDFSSFCYAEKEYNVRIILTDDLSVQAFFQPVRIIFYNSDSCKTALEIDPDPMT
jgi:hypothetical protein